MSPTEDLRETCQSRGFLRLMRVDRLANLLDWLTNPLADRDLAAEVAAECAVRAWLGRQVDPWHGIEIPPQVLPSGVEQHLRSWLRRNQEKRLMDYDGERPGSGEVGDVLLTYLDQSLSMWRDANGFVPLVIRDDGHEVSEAIALPFMIRLRSNRNDPLVATADGFQSSVAGLRGSWEKAWETAVANQWVSDADLLQARMIGLTPVTASLPCGDSATMPFLAAIFQHVRKLRVPSLGWAASGEVDVIFARSTHTGHLAQEWSAKQRLIDSIGIAEDRRLLPGSKYPAPMNGTEELGTLLHSMFIDCQSVPNLEETRRELQQIDDSMRNARPELPVLASQLDRMLEQVSGLSGLQWEDCRSRAIKLRADLYCHQGAPDRCIQLLPELAASTSKAGCDARIRIAVAMTDLCKHDECDRVATSALNAAEGLPPLDRHIVQLHALGTRGQGRMYKALENLDQSLAESGRNDLEEALRLAKELDVGVVHDKWAQPRNLTYSLLWYALFRPVEAGEWYHEATTLARAARHGDGYVQRAAYLARYRALLTGDDTRLPWWPVDDPPIPDPAFAGGWPAATALKYRGTFLAHVGDMEGAQHEFNHASAILKPTAGWLLSFVRGTILLQAGESLIASKPGAALEYLRESASLFEMVHGFGLIHPQSPVAPEKWLLRACHVLDQGSAPELNPQRFFQY
jgi:hypothetical protein